MLTLILGGTRSGKSDIAEELVGSGPVVTYLATARITSPRMEARVARHRSVRPATWQTVEEALDIVPAVRAAAGTLVIEDIPNWLRNDVEGADVIGLAHALRARREPSIVLSQEVGMGGAPSEADERFHDRLGEANQVLSRIADRCYLVLASRVLEIPKWHGEAKEVVALQPRPGYGS